MRKQDFYGLPRSIQDRFIESSQGAAAPIPLAAVVRKDKASLFWGLLSLGTIAAWGFFISFGFGDLTSDFALSSPLHRALHVAFAVLTTFFALKSYGRSWSLGRLPYAPGDYLFPFGVISARFGEVAEYDGGQLTSVSASGAEVEAIFGSQRFRFSTRSPEDATLIADKVQTGTNKWRTLKETENLERARLNPLVDSGIHNPLAPTQPHVRPRFIGGLTVVLLAAFIGVAAGFGVSVWRDSLSQKALFKQAMSENTIDSYRAYIKRGGNREEVSSLLLPRAELERAMEAGTVEAIQGFVDNNPDTQIAGEVQNALKAALLRDLEQAKKAGTLKALEELKKRHPSHRLIAVEWESARKDIFARALLDFQAKASTKEPGVVGFVREMLSYAEANGPTVQLRMAHEFPQDIKMLDQIVSKSEKYYMGRKSLPTQYFLGENARRRERALLEKVRERLQSAFSPDLIRFEIAPLPQAENVPLGDPEVPSISFKHRENLSGGYVGGLPKAMYMGAAIVMSARAQIPGKPEHTLAFDWSAWKNPNFAVLTDTKKDIPDVYEDMMGNAFESFTQMYLARWIAPE